MTPMTPAGELRQAAATLRELAAKATPGPWDEDGFNITSTADPLATGDDWDSVADAFDGDNARWIAAVSPDNADAVATMLEHLADAGGWPRIVGDFARRINAMA